MLHILGTVGFWGTNPSSSHRRGAPCPAGDASSLSQLLAGNLLLSRSDKEKQKKRDEKKRKKKTPNNDVYLFSNGEMKWESCKDMFANLLLAQLTQRRPDPDPWGREL